MAWADLPRFANDYAHKSDLDDIRAAIVERCDAAGVSTAGLAASPSGNKTTVTAAWLNNWRAKIVSLLSHYYGYSDDNVYNLNRARVAAGLSGTDWYRIPPGYPGGPTYGSVTPSVEQLYAAHVNEMYEILKLLQHLRVYMEGATTKYVLVGYGSRATDDLAWTAAKADWFLDSWASGGSAGAGFNTAASHPSNYTCTIQENRLNSFNYVIPAGITIAQAKLVIDFVLQSSGGDGSGEVDLFEQADFAGAEQTVASGGTSNRAYPVVSSPAPGSTVYFSLRCRPYDPDPSYEEPDPDLYRCSAPPPDKTRGYIGLPYLLILTLTFIYT